MRVLVIGLAVGLAACSAIESQTNSFATLDEARKAGAVDQGWVPDGLPPSTHELREAHVPGGTERWGLFNFAPADAEALRTLMRPEELPLASLRCDPPGRIEWWPLALRGRLDAEKLGSTGLRAYRARSSNLIFAVNWNQGRAYYWAEERE